MSKFYRNFVGPIVSHGVGKRIRGSTCEMCGKKFTADQPDVNYHARTRIMHIHAHCARKAHIQL